MRQKAANASALQSLRVGFLIVNTIHLVLVFYAYRSKATWGSVIKYASTEAVAVALWLTLEKMARDGDDLKQTGLTAYMFDIIYVTWFVHVGTALFGSWVWWIWAVIPLYASYIAYSKLVVPFVLGGRDPLRGLFSAFAGSSGGTAPVDQAATEDNAAGQSKRQAKLQKRAEKGDPRVQMQQREAGNASGTRKR
ncbi:Predicted membrane protein [Ceraceosorus bombacis]|uniref:Predicted membrane protein n=1 Tax=Ceraceosorus bombacis TaxID=401625 RepID=A0A0P1BIR6_9BASI|nr:Predicted membrane protein [Ceraceosorus bombacis]